MAAKKKPLPGCTGGGERCLRFGVEKRGESSTIHRCHGCAIPLTWRDGRTLCRHCRAAELRHGIHHVRPGRPCPGCGAEVATWRR